MASTVTQSIVLKPGEVFSLPPGGELKFVSDAHGITTDCGNPPITNYKCGYFLFVIDNDNNTGHPFDDSAAGINRLFVGDIVYDLGDISAGLIADTSSPAPGRIDLLNAGIPDQFLFTFTWVGLISFSKRKYIVLYFKVSDIYFDNLLLEIDERVSDADSPSPLFGYFKPTPYPCNQYDFNF